MWKHLSPQSICPSSSPPLKWQACHPNGDGLAQTAETSQNTIVVLCFFFFSWMTGTEQVLLYFIDLLKFWKHTCKRVESRLGNGVTVFVHGIWRSCDFRTEKSVFQGPAFSSGISPVKSHSQQHSGSKWKGTSGCSAERFWVEKHSSI